MLNEEVAKYRELSGDTNPNTPISRIGGYLDGYEKALEQEPCEVSQGLVKNSQGFSQEPCENYISRQAVFDTEYQIKEINGIEYVMLSEVQMKIRKMPSVNPTKTGYWTRELIRNEKGGCIGAKMICSECGNDNKHDEYMNYCPNCGTKMFEPQERSE